MERISRIMSDSYPATRAPFLNRGLSWTHEERKEKKVRGLFPGGEPFSLEKRVNHAMEQLGTKKTPLDKYVYLHTLQDADESLFYSILSTRTTETMPYVYTPTVGEACQKWGEIYRSTPRGLYLTMNDKGSIHEILDNHPHKDIKVIVVTDGERILGLGDLGVNGMGIPIGKLALYTACAGVHPDNTLPVHLDVGTNNKELRESEFYMGLKQERVRGPEYDALIAEFFEACQKKYGKEVLIQFEDFGNMNAFRLLEDYRNKALTFNDDIQGTASVVLAGVMSSLPLVKKLGVGDHTYLFNGAGEAGVGIADLITSSIVKEKGCSEQEARQQIWLVDSKGLVTSERTGLAHHKLNYAHEPPKMKNGQSCGGDALLDAVNAIEPSALMGVSAQGGSFTETILKRMAALNEHPLIFALSNPTSKAECTATEAYIHTNGRAVFASGSPFDPVTLADGSIKVPGQGNNAYIFPGVGLGALAAGATKITDDDFYVASKALASQVTTEHLKQGCAYPPLSDIRQVSLVIAAAVAQNINEQGHGTKVPAEGDTYLGMCAKLVYTPKL